MQLPTMRSSLTLAVQLLRLHLGLQQLVTQMTGVQLDLWRCCLMSVWSCMMKERMHPTLSARTASDPLSPAFCRLALEVRQPSVLAGAANAVCNRAMYPSVCARASAVQQVELLANVCPACYNHAAQCRRVPCREATLPELCAVHTDSLVHMVEAASLGAAASDTCSFSLTPDTYVNRHTYLCAKLAAGGAAEMAALVARGDVPHGAAIVRPPGATCNNQAMCVQAAAAHAVHLDLNPV